jgi:hypothetical protein
VKCPRPPDRSPSLNLRLREKRLENQLPPSRRPQALKSPPNRVFYEFSLRAAKRGHFYFAITGNWTATGLQVTWISSFGEEVECVGDSESSF